jgi:hypothetical protein
VHCLSVGPEGFEPSLAWLRTDAKITSVFHQRQGAT